MIDYLSSDANLLTLDALCYTDRAQSSVAMLRRLQAGEVPERLLKEALRICRLGDAQVLLHDPIVTEDAARRKVLRWILDHLKRQLVPSMPVNILGIRSLDILNLGYGPIYWYNVTGFDNRVLYLIDQYFTTNPAGVSDHEDLTSLFGHIDHYHVSQAFQDKEDELLALLFVQPSVSISLTSPPGLQRRGTAVSAAFVANTSNGSVSAPTLLWSTGATTSSIVVPGVSNSLTVSVTATFPNPAGSPIVKTASATLPFYAPIFYGVGAPGISGAGNSAINTFLDTLTELLGPVAASRDLLFTQAAGQTRYYAQPSGENGYDSSGLSSIVNNLGYEVISSWTKIASVPKILGGATINYDFYEYQTPAALPVTVLKNTFKQ